jgi:hypothetical protein
MRRIHDPKIVEGSRAEFKDPRIRNFFVPNQPGDLPNKRLSSTVDNCDVRDRFDQILRNRSRLLPIGALIGVDDRADDRCKHRRPFDSIADCRASHDPAADEFRECRKPVGDPRLIIVRTITTGRFFITAPMETPPPFRTSASNTRTMMESARSTRRKKP